MPPPPDDPLPWFYEDVQFNSAKANTAKTALETLAQYLDALGTVRATTADAHETGPRYGWEGRFRVDFDREFPVTQQRLSDAASALRTFNGTIAEAIEEAARSQWGREQMREQYENPPPATPTPTTGPR